MSKIFVCCGTMESGGAERVLSVLSPALADAFDEVTYVTWREAPDFYDVDKRIRRISLPIEAKTDSLFAKMRRFRHIVKKEKPDLVVSFLTPFNLLTMLALKGVKVKKAVAERNDPRFIKGGRMMHWIRRQLYDSSDHILCQTEAMARFFGGRLSKKTHVIFNPLFLKPELVGQATSSQKKHRIISIGRLDYQKNQGMLIDAFAEFRKTHPDYSLTIYGEGDLREGLERKIDQLGLKSCVHLPGSKKNVHNLMLDAEMMVMSSHFEGMPNALIEAMALGLPCISTKVSGATELIESDKNGILVDTTIENLSASMSRLADDKEFRDAIAREGIKIAHKLDPTEICRQWVDFLNKISE